MTETDLDMAFEEVLARYQIPLTGLVGGADRGDLASDLAAAARRLLPFVPFGSIHTRQCMESASIDPDEGALVGDEDAGCLCEGIRTYIRAADADRAPRQEVL